MSSTKRSSIVSESALTVGDVVRRLMPYGTQPTPERQPWRKCPEWAADVFAATAGVVHASSCYTEPGVALSRNDSERQAKLERATLHKKTGKDWANSVEVPRLVRRHWATLYGAFDQPIDDTSPRSVAWKLAALALVAISDEAFAGAGFFPDADDGIANFVWFELLADRKKGGATLLELPWSMTVLVPSEIACVLPKSLTPNVGCTLRSLTHHLAFLPGKAIVAPGWLINPGGHEIGRLLRQERKRGRQASADDAPDGVFNVLLVPFPYVIHATDFKVSRPAIDESDGYFTLTQDWLREGRRRVPINAMVNFIGELIENAEQDAGPIHAIILPEAALDKAMSRGIVERLAVRFRHLELIITGMIAGPPASQRNFAAQYRLIDGEIVSTVEQSKHHRWRLEESQIRQYQLGGVLDPNHIWWEHIDVHNRKIGFSVNRHDAIIAALVCEDLARYDPVLPTVAAVGPTLVVALLLDGPQLPNRWPGRYATVLAEDPGSSVLTLTSLGMIERSTMPGTESRAVVGLWKERHGAAKELVLPRAHHGLVLSLNCCHKKQVTLDHRVDKDPTLEYRLGATRAVRLKNIPAWLERRVGSA